MTLMSEPCFLQHYLLLLCILGSLLAVKSFVHLFVFMLTWFFFFFLNTSSLLSSCSKTNASTEGTQLQLVCKHFWHFCHWLIRTFISHIVFVCKVFVCACVKKKVELGKIQHPDICVSVCFHICHLSHVSSQTCRVQSLSQSLSNYNSPDRKIPRLCVCVFAFSLSGKKLLTNPLLVMKPVCLYPGVCVCVCVSERPARYVWGNRAWLLTQCWVVKSVSVYVEH